MLWLDHGYLEGDDTDAHIDTLARFAAARRDRLPGLRRPDRLALRRTAGDGATKSPRCAPRDGQPYRLFPLPWAQPILDEGRRLAASYANFLIVNGAVLMPAYGDPADAARRRGAGKAFPGREIVQVPCRPLIWQNGSLHCITMQLPRRTARDDPASTTLPVALIQERNHGDAEANLAVIEARVAEAAQARRASWCCCRNCTTAPYFCQHEVGRANSTWPNRSRARAPSAWARWRSSTAW